MSETNQKEFGKWRSIFWPIYRFELKKMIPVSLIFFLVLFNYTILRDTKDSLIIPSAGAEAVPFIKFWGVVPIAVVFMLIYAKLSNKLSKPGLFYSIITPFIIFFALFAFVLYPMRDSLHPNAFADWMQATLPQGFAGLVGAIRNWTYTLFYILAELWGSAVLSLMFWGFANDIVKSVEAKRFYSVFGAFANLALMVSGTCIIMFSDIRAKLPADVDAWGVSLKYLMGMVVLAGVLIMLIYRWINKNVLTDPRFYKPEEIQKNKKEKPKMSIKESFRFLLKSRYLGLIAILVMGYGIAINIIEVTWKKQVGMYFPNPNDYSTFMGQFSRITGIVAILTSLFLGSNVIRRLGWKFAALVTPIMLLVTGSIFFTAVMGREHLGTFTAMFATSPLFLIVIIGAAQNILSKSSKYAFFDPTKEMSYIPLDQESKVKGKAAVDVVGARLGKAGGSIMQQGLIIGCGSLLSATPYLAGILMFIVVAWIVAASKLNKLYLAKEEEKALEKAKETEAVVAKAKKPAVAQEEAAVASSTTLK